MITMKTITYILFCLAFSTVCSGKTSKAEYLKMVSKALKANLLHDADAFKLTMKIVSLL